VRVDRNLPIFEQDNESHKESTTTAEAKRKASIRHKLEQEVNRRRTGDKRMWDAH
jgi:hypothetical protein